MKAVTSACVVVHWLGRGEVSVVLEAVMLLGRSWVRECAAVVEAGAGSTHCGVKVRHLTLACF